ncbi:hypothetical protein VTO42DRAFT_5445 [Malbranchea cinnamomea]
MDADLLDSLLDLEESFYEEGYRLGTKDGAKAGYNEGTVFAVEKGFEKFQEMGRLYGRGIIWAKRLPGDHDLLLPSHSKTGETDGGDASSQTPDDAQTVTTGSNSAPGAAAAATPLNGLNLPDLPTNARLEKHLAAFLSLVDPTTLSMDNTEEAVEHFDDRLKKARAKARIIEKMIGEPSEPVGHEGNSGTQALGNNSIEDVGPLPPRLLQTTS